MVSECPLLRLSRIIRRVRHSVNAREKSEFMKLEVDTSDYLEVGIVEASITLKLSTEGSPESAVEDDLLDSEVRFRPDGRLFLEIETPLPVIDVLDQRKESVTVEKCSMVNDSLFVIALRFRLSAPDRDAQTIEEGELPPFSENGKSNLDSRIYVDSPAGETTQPHHDRERLETVYERCTTFAEMRDELGVDVTDETIRKNMIKYGIHSPMTYDTGSGEDDDPLDESTERESATHVDESDVAESSRRDFSESLAAGDAVNGSPVKEGTGDGLDVSEYELESDGTLPDETRIREVVNNVTSIDDVKTRLGIEISNDDAHCLLADLGVLGQLTDSEEVDPTSDSRRVRSDGETKVSSSEGGQ